MKLKNKKTGEIIELLAKPSFVKRNDNYLESEVNTFNSLAELNEEWEDYEEPKEYWYIENNGDIDKETYEGDEYEEEMIEIGNYFETKEEAEKAVKKLKAWKRLKDKGFEFNGWEDSPAEDDFDMIWFTMKAKVWDVDTQEALDLLFSQEDD